MKAIYEPKQISVKFPSNVLMQQAITVGDVQEMKQWSSNDIYPLVRILTFSTDPQRTAGLHREPA